MRASAVLSCLALTAGAVLVAAPAEADGPPPACGSTVLASTTLRSDLTCPAPGPALTLAAGVDLNLGGHTLRGPGSGLGIAIPVAGDITIRNGTIAGWGQGVQTVGTDDGGASGVVTVRNVTFDGNTDGLDASGDIPAGHYGKQHVVTRSTFSHNARGILAGWFTHVDVSRTSFAGNGTALVVDSSDVTVDDSRIEQNTNGVTVIEGTVQLRRTDLLQNDRAVSAQFMSSTTLTDSLVKGSDVGVSGFGLTFFTLTGSTFAANTTAVSFDGSDGTVSGNTFRSNGTGFEQTSPSTDGVRVQDNVFRLGGDGIRIDAGDTQTSVGGNAANNNTGWGIYAPGVTDLGGNTARRNGNSPQCVGVVCPAS